MALPTISIASSVVGFISFAFTFFTFLKVFWESIVTMWSAHKEIRALLDNLRTELYGERAYFKDAIKQARSKSKTARQTVEITPLSILNDSIKAIMREFRQMEEPFLDNTPDGDDLDIEKSGRVSLRGTYAPMDVWRRYLWLQQKSDFIAIANQVTRIQARRIAFETSHALECIHEIEKTMHDLDDRIYRLEEHFLGETLEDGNVYVKRRYTARGDLHTFQSQKWILRYFGWTRVVSDDPSCQHEYHLTLRSCQWSDKEKPEEQITKGVSQIISNSHGSLKKSISSSTSA